MITRDNFDTLNEYNVEVIEMVWYIFFVFKIINIRIENTDILLAFVNGNFYCLFCL